MCWWAPLPKLVTLRDQEARSFPAQPQGGRMLKEHQNVSDKVLGDPQGRWE